AGESKTWDFLCLRKPRKPVVLLLLGAELVQQLARAERIRHHRGDCTADRARRDLANDLGVRVGRKSQSAILLRNDQRKEFAALEKIPDLGRQIAQLPIYLPIVEHAAELVHGPVEECLLLCGQGGTRECNELFPIRAAAEQLTIPPDVAG